MRNRKSKSKSQNGAARQQSDSPATVNVAANPVKSSASATQSVQTKSLPSVTGRRSLAASQLLDASDEESAERSAQRIKLDPSVDAASTQPASVLNVIDVPNETGVVTNSQPGLPNAIPIPPGPLPPGQIGTLYSVGQKDTQPGKKRKRNRFKKAAQTQEEAQGPHPDQSTDPGVVEPVEPGDEHLFNAEAKEQMKLELVELSKAEDIGENSEDIEEDSDHDEEHRYLHPDDEDRQVDDAESPSNSPNNTESEPKRPYRYKPKHWDGAPLIQYNIMYKDVSQKDAQFTCPETKVSVLNDFKLSQGAVWEYMRELNLDGFSPPPGTSAETDAAEFINACIRLGALIEPNSLSALLGGGYRSPEYCDFLLTAFVTLQNNKYVSRAVTSMENGDKKSKSAALKGQGDSHADVEQSEEEGDTDASLEDDDDSAHKLSFVLRNYLQNVSGIQFDELSEYDRYLRGIGRSLISEEEHVDSKEDTRIRWRREAMPAPVAGILGKAVGGPVSVWRRAKDTFPEKLMSRCALIQYDRVLDWLSYVAANRSQTEGEERFYRERTPVVSIDPVPLLFLADSAMEYALEILQVAVHVVTSDPEDDDSDSGEMQTEAEDKDDTGDQTIADVEKSDTTAASNEKRGGGSDGNSESNEATKEDKEMTDADLDDKVKEFDITRTIDPEDIQVAFEMLAKKRGRRPAVDSLYGERCWNDQLEKDVLDTKLWMRLKQRPITDEENVLLCNRMPTKVISFPTDVVLELKAVLGSFWSTNMSGMYTHPKDIRVKRPPVQSMTKEELAKLKERRSIFKNYHVISPKEPFQMESSINGAESSADIRPIVYSANQDLAEPRTETELSTGMDKLTADDRILQPRYSLAQKPKRSTDPEHKMPEEMEAEKEYMKYGIHVAELVSHRKRYIDMKEAKDVEMVHPKSKNGTERELTEFLKACQLNGAMKSHNSVCFHRLSWICLHALGIEVESDGYGEVVDYSKFGELKIDGEVKLAKSAVFHLSALIDVFVRHEAELLMACAAHDNGRPWIDRADVALMTSLRKQKFGYEGL